jgi:hypothetical protein
VAEPLSMPTWDIKARVNHVSEMDEPQRQDQIMAKRVGLVANMATSMVFFFFFYLPLRFVSNRL